jgi:hypothetical protein
MFNEQAHAKKSGELDINQITNPSGPPAYLSANLSGPIANPVGQFNPALAAKKPYHEKTTGDIIDEVLKEADDADKSKDEAEKQKETEHLSEP